MSSSQVIFRKISVQNILKQSFPLNRNADDKKQQQQEQQNKQKKQIKRLINN